jgi:flagellar biosynthesis protein FlhA
MTAIFIRRPLEFSSFPAVLLITTMMRLALNLASTRLILAHGNTGTAAAGYVIQAFGKLIMQGNFVIGLIVFSILVVVNFVVITKGSGASRKWPRASPWMPCRASRWRSTPIFRPA